MQIIKKSSHKKYSIYFFIKICFFYLLLIKSSDQIRLSDKVKSFDKVISSDKVKLFNKAAAFLISILSYYYFTLFLSIS